MWILLGLACGWLPPQASLWPPPGAADDAEVRLEKAGDVLVAIGYCDPGECSSVQVKVAAAIDGERVEVGVLVGADQTVPLLEAGRLCSTVEAIRDADRPNTWMMDATTFECGKGPGR